MGQRLIMLLLRTNLLNATSSRLATPSHRFPYQSFQEAALQRRSKRNAPAQLFLQPPRLGLRMQPQVLAVVASMINFLLVICSLQNLLIPSWLDRSELMTSARSTTVWLSGPHPLPSLWHPMLDVHRLCSLPVECGETLLSLPLFGFMLTALRVHVWTPSCSSVLNCM